MLGNSAAQLVASPVVLSNLERAFTNLRTATERLKDCHLQCMEIMVSMN
jgi:hypothetical protein